MPNRYWILILATALCSSPVGARQPASAVVAFTHVAVVDAGGTPTERDRTVVVTGDRISEIGGPGEVRVRPGARVVDANGKYLIHLKWMIKLKDVELRI